MTNNTTTVRVLENNLKPATHFIEVSRWYTYHSMYHKPISIDNFNQWIKQSLWLNLHTVAIFKIRMKPQ